MGISLDFDFGLNEAEIYDLPNGATVVVDGVAYVPERTCKPVKVTVTTSFYDEYAEEFESDGCPYCEIPLADYWSYCPECGAKVVE